MLIDFLAGQFKGYEKMSNDVYGSVLVSHVYTLGLHTIVS